VKLSATSLFWSVVVAALLFSPSGALAARATVRVPKAQIHTAPDSSSPVVYTFPRNTRLSVSDEDYDGFRKVFLPDRSVGYVEEGAIAVAAAPNAQSNQAQPPPAQAPPSAPPQGAPPPPPYGQPPPPPQQQPQWSPYRPYGMRFHDPTAFRHLGLFLRFDLGLGYMNSYRPQNAPSSATNFDTSEGFALAPGFSIGGAIAENLILAGQFWGSFVPDPTLSMGGISIPAGGGFSHALYALGPNLTWYFMPENVYLSVTPSVTWVNFSDPFISLTTSAGFGGRIAAGKEWWVGPHVGLGLNGWFGFSFNREGGGANLTWRTFAGGLGFSTTLN